MGLEDPGFLAVGLLARPHGIKGELIVSPLTDHPESTFAPGVVLRIGDPELGEPDPARPPLRVLRARPVRAGLIVAFDGIESRSEAEMLRGCHLLRETAALEPLEEGEVYHHQLLGLEVHTVSGERLGRVTAVYDLVPVELLEVRDGPRETMIPFRKEIIVELDVDGGRIVVDPPDGLLDL
ncbi:MAG: ribosome maturation factor RimM [Gemmatimonadota bacterium]|jgi:16S rRNA processing protein RimM